MKRLKYILEYKEFNILLEEYRTNVELTDKLTIINTFKEIVNLSGTKNRRFMYNPKTGTLLLGDVNKDVSNSSHESEFNIADIKEKYDDFVRGWIGFDKKEFKNGIIHFYSTINSYDDIFDTIVMFAYMGGINPKTKIRGVNGISGYTYISDYLSDTYNNKTITESYIDNKQLKQIKSDNFINWFGDWINDPENASMVVNENGEPLIVYHSSNHRFYKFNKNLQQQDGFHGKGFYFMSGDKYANKELYGKITYEVYLNCRNIFDINAYYDIDTIKYILGVDYIKYEKIIKDELEFSYEGKIGGFVIYPMINNDILIERGYDGIKHSNIYVVFESTQIKSATNNNGDFNSKNENINK